MDRDELKSIVDRKGMDWLIAAMVDGSIGYHTPPGAKRLIESALQGETKDYCERCLAIYKGDLLKMIEDDIEKLEYLEKHYPEKVKRLIETVKKISGLDQQQQTTISLMYPTMGI